MPSDSEIHDRILHSRFYTGVEDEKLSNNFAWHYERHWVHCFYKWYLDHLERDSSTFKEWYKTEYQVEPTNLQKRTEKRKKELIKQCRYYRGESISPWNDLSTGMWSTTFVLYF